jgi:hypothetical protein
MHNCLKNNIRYKELRHFLKYMLGKPDYYDIIKNGVSLKWYHKSFYLNIPTSFRKNLKENIIKEIPKTFFTYFDIQVKIFHHPPISPLYGNRRDTTRGLRILIRRKNIE